LRFLQGRMVMAQIRIAVPCWGDLISPVFDVAQNLLLVDISDGVETGRQNLSMAGMQVPVKVEAIRNSGVDAVICGAISGMFVSMLTSNRIKVQPWNSGKVDEIIQAVLQDRLSDPRYCMPGCRRRRCRWGWGRR